MQRCHRYHCCLLTCAAGGDAGGNAEGMDDGAAGDAMQWRHLSAAMEAIYYDAAHVWDYYGKHVRFRSGQEMITHISTTYGSVKSQATVFRYRREEKERYAAGGGCRKKQDLAAIIDAAAKAQKEAASIMVEPEEREEGADGLRVKFLLEWRVLLKERLTPLIGSVGFGPLLVGIFAADIAAKRGSYNSWRPSYTWCRHFLYKHMNLVVRDVTGHAISAKSHEQQLRLHEANLDWIAELRNQGWADWQFFAVDEFGSFLFPCANRVWALKGARRVLAPLREDKRQLSGALALAGDGTVPVKHMVFDGKTDRSLPSPAVLEKFPEADGWLFDVTSNHWMQHVPKVRFTYLCCL
jgi:hypothetical protein